MTASSIPDDPRREQLRSNLAAVRRRIDDACAAARRDPSDVTLIAVTKYFPASDVVALAELGATDFGESRDQEAAPKATEVAELTSPSTAGRPRWHFVGQLQSKKARSVARYADVVHSVDRDSLVTALDAGVERAGRERLPVLIQVNLDSTADPGGDTEAGRGGVGPSGLARLADQVSAAAHLELAGLMAIAPLYGDPDAAFARLAVTAETFRSEYPHARMLSAGMSGDLEAAIRYGATHVRIGTALLGRRRPDFG